MANFRSTEESWLVMKVFFIGRYHFAGPNTCRPRLNGENRRWKFQTRRKTIFHWSLKARNAFGMVRSLYKIKPKARAVKGKLVEDEKG